MEKAARPNIIVILADDQGYGDMGIYGNSIIQTPNLDRLAHGGVRLSQHYSASPMCAPARASLLTGRYNHRTGAIDVPSNRGLDRISLRESTIADVFKSTGYTTGMVGKWHNGIFDMKYHPNSRGFDEFVGFLNGGMWYWNWILDYNGTPHRSDGRYLTDVFTDEAVDFIYRYRHKAFFLYIAYNTPHLPLEAPEADFKAFAETGILNNTVSAIYAMIRRMDWGIGRIIDSLERYGLYNNTLILFTSDNGPVLANCSEGDFRRYNGPFRGQKGDVLEGGIRVPAILHWPAGLQEEQELHQMIHFTDWFSTLLAAAGIKVPSGLELDGTNILPILQGEPGKVKTKRYWQWNYYQPVPCCNAAMRDGKWKLYWPKIPEAMVKLPIDGEWYYRLFDEPHFPMGVDTVPVKRELSAQRQPELYDIENDPYETNDLSRKYPNRLAKMKREIENWFEAIEKERKERVF